MAKAEPENPPAFLHRLRIDDELFDCVVYDRIRAGGSQESGSEPEELVQRQNRAGASPSEGTDHTWAILDGTRDPGRHARRTPAR